MSAQEVGDSEKPSAASGLDGVESVEGACADQAALRGGGAAPQAERITERVDVLWSVDCETEDTFLYAAITNISAMGIFVRTEEPLAVGTSVTLRFAPPRARGQRAADPQAGPALPSEAFVLDGVVQWVNRVRPREDNLNPGMGIRFAHLTLADRERIVEASHTIAYLREEPRAELPS